MSAGAVEVSTVDALGPELDELLPEWDALALRVGAGFAARPAFALDWWASLGRGRLAVTTARRDGLLVAVAPLHRRHVAGRSVLRWLGHGEALLGELVAAEPHEAKAVWRELVNGGAPLQLARTRLAGLLELRRLHAEQGCGRLRMPVVAHSRLLGPADRPVAGSPGARPTAPPAEVELLTGADGVRARSREMRRLSQSSTTRAALESTLIETALRTGDLAVVGAVVDGRWVAHLTLLRRGRSFEVWSLCAHRAVDRLAVGDLLVRAVLDRCAELGVDGVDLGLGGAELEAAWPGEGYDVVTLLRAPGHAAVAARRIAQGVDGVRRRGATS